MEICRVRFAATDLVQRIKFKALLEKTNYLQPDQHNQVVAFSYTQSLNEPQIPSGIKMYHFGKGWGMFSVLFSKRLTMERYKECLKTECLKGSSTDHTVQNLTLVIL